MRISINASNKEKGEFEKLVKDFEEKGVTLLEKKGGQTEGISDFYALFVKKDGKN